MSDQIEQIKTMLNESNTAIGLHLFRNSVFIVFKGDEFCEAVDFANKCYDAGWHGTNVSMMRLTKNQMVHIPFNL